MSFVKLPADPSLLHRALAGQSQCRLSEFQCSPAAQCRSSHWPCSHTSYALQSPGCGWKWPEHGSPLGSTGPPVGSTGLFVVVGVEITGVSGTSTITTSFSSCAASSTTLYIKKHWFSSLCPFNPKTGVPMESINGNSIFTFWLLFQRTLWMRSWIISQHSVDCAQQRILLTIAIILEIVQIECPNHRSAQFHGFHKFALVPNHQRIVE